MGVRHVVAANDADIGWPGKGIIATLLSLSAESRKKVITRRRIIKGGIAWYRQ